MSALPSPSPAGTYPTSPPNGFRMDAKRIRYHRGGHSRQENLRARGRARMRNTVGVKAGPKAKGACRRNAGHMIRAGALLAAPITLLCAVPRSSGVPASAATCRQAKNRASTEEAAIRLAGPQTRTAPVTFYRDVLPILQRHCEACHRAGGIAPMAFETYAETKPFAEAIRAATQAKTMPPWFADPTVGKFSNDSSLSAEGSDELAAWAENGAVAGDPHEGPPPRTWAASRTIPQPDLVLKMPQAVRLPANGDVEYTYELVPTHFAEDRCVQMSEVLPSARTNVHHAVVYIRPPTSNWLRRAPAGRAFTASELSDPEERRNAHWTTDDILLVYAPGSSPDMWPDTMAKLVPAGSDLVFQMHYTTNGHAGTDQTSVGMIFLKHAPEKRVLTLQLTNDHFGIRPGAEDYRVEADGTLPNDALLLSFFPHMHLRGKRFEYNIIHRRSGGAAVG